MAGAPYWKGLQPVESITGSAYVFPTETYQAKAGNALYRGQVVKFDADGLVVPVANSDATETGVLGVIQGIFYPREGDRDVNTTEVTAAQNDLTGVRNVAGFGATFGFDFDATEGVAVQVAIDPSLNFAVKATEAISRSDLGDLVQLVDNATAASVTHTGTVAAGHADEATAGGILRVVNVVSTNNTSAAYAATNIANASGLVNTWDSPETIVIVRFDPAHRLF